MIWGREQGEKRQDTKQSRNETQKMILLSFGVSNAKSFTLATAITAYPDIPKGRHLNTCCWKCQIISIATSQRTKVCLCLCYMLLKHCEGAHTVRSGDRPTYNETKRKHFRDIKDEQEPDKADTLNGLHDTLHLQIKSVWHRHLFETHYVELSKKFFLFYFSSY